MIELEFMLPPQVECQGDLFDIRVTPAATTLPGHENLVHLILYPLEETGRRKSVSGPLYENPQVPRTEAGILTEIAVLAMAGHLAEKKRRTRRRLIRNVG